MLNASAPGKKSVRSPPAARSADPQRIGVTPAVIQHALRGLTDRNVARCRWKRVQPTVQIVEYASDTAKRMGVNGVHTCKSSMCAFCVRRIQRVRSDEIKRANDHWAEKRLPTAFVTPTSRHNRGMDLGMVHALYRDAWGHMWSGRAAAPLVAELGGKPEGCRTFDWTYSVEHGWHPHLHVILYMKAKSLVGLQYAPDLDPFDPAELLQSVDPDVASMKALESRLFVRWTQSLKTSLDRMDRMTCRVLGLEPLNLTGNPFLRRPARGCGRRKARPGRPLCTACYPEDGEITECPHLRERAQRLFGCKKIPKGDSLELAIRRVRDSLRAFKWSAVEPSRHFCTNADGVARRVGLHAEWTRSADDLGRYLVKMGLHSGKMAAELACATDKLGRVGNDGLRHYSLWEVAHLASDLRHPQCSIFRSAWSQLFWAKKGMQVVIFSDRDKLGLGPDPLAGDGDVEERDPSETVRVMAQVMPDVWDANARLYKQGLIVTLETAYARGELETLPWLSPPSTWAHGIPSTTGPPETGPPKLNEWCFGWQSLEVEQQAERRGAAFFREALSDGDSKERDQGLFKEELQYRLQQMGLIVSSQERAELRAKLIASGQLTTREQRDNERQQQARDCEPAPA